MLRHKRCIIVFLIYSVQQLLASVQTVFQENQLEEECGEFAETIHKNHDASVEHTGISADKSKNKNHLQFDSRVVDIKWPWQTVVKVNGKYQCTGMLVKKNWVLTTASCVEGETLKLEVQISNATYKTLSVHQHPGFDPKRKNKMAGDIALIKLETAVPTEAKSDVSPICLPRSKSQLKQTTECSVTYMKEEEDKKIDTFSSSGKIVKKTDCEQAKVKIDGSLNMLMCIATKSNMMTTCEDPPLMFFMCKSSGFWSIYGVSKFCNRPGAQDDEYCYAYFLETLSYLQWIKDIQERN